MPKRNIIWIVAILAATATAMWLSQSDPYQPGPGRPGRFSRLGRILARIEQDYYHSLDSKKLTELAEIGGLRAVTELLDEFSSYVPPDKVETFKERMAGTGRGLGLRTRQVLPAPPVVTAVLYNSPAYRAGVQVGWRIVRIDQRDVARCKPGDIRQALCPPLGESVSLTFRAAEGRDKVQTIQLTSQAFGIESVTGLYHLRYDSRWARRWAWMLDEPNAIVYIRVREFVGNTVERFDEALRAARAGTAPRAVLLDLRGNPGGQSSAAIRLADMFLAKGLIVRMLERKDRVDRPRDGKAHNAHSLGTLADIPVVVLVDERTASGAELVAGALWAHHRAVLVGRRTRGKWCAQSMNDLGDGLGLLNLTTSHFVFSRPPISANPEKVMPGVEPHVTVEIAAEDRQALAEIRAEAERPLAAKDSRPTTRPARANRRTRMLGRLLELDSQLDAALALLRRPGRYQALLDAERLRAKRQAEARKAGPGRPDPGDGDD